MLLEVPHRLVERGNTVLVIEHNVLVIKTADWILDLGPEGGPRGGEIVAEGPPEVVARSPRSFTRPLPGAAAARHPRAGPRAAAGVEGARAQGADGVGSAPPAGGSGC
jgi:excinuclease ABC subunit A